MVTEATSRSTFASSWGTILSTAGVAIGLGNIWRFPYMMGQHGGALFLVAYLLIAIAFGLPGLMAEWSLARHTRRGTLGAFERAGLPGGRYVSYLLLLTVLMASSYYGVVVGWVLYFAVHFGLNVVSIETSGSFESLSTNFSVQAISLVAVSSICAGVLYLGVHRGIERLSRWGLPVFFVVLAVLMVRALTLPGAWEGTLEYLKPNWDQFTRTTPLAAMGQVFFSFGLGGTFMLAYGSYMRNEEDIPRAAVFTAGADVMAALMAGLVVVPAALAFGLPTRSGPALMFEVMPAVFEHMPAGAVFGLMFFGSIFIVALLSQMAAFEVVVSAITDSTTWARKRSVIAVALVSTTLAIPALLSVDYVEFSDFVWGSTMQPVGGLLAVIAFAWYVNMGDALSEMRRSSRLPVPTWLFHWIRVGVPVGIVSTLVFSWVEG